MLTRLARSIDTGEWLFGGATVNPEHAEGVFLWVVNGMPRWLPA